MKKLYTLTLSVLVFVATTVTGQNMLTNSGFETGMGAPWVTGGTNPISIDSVTVYEGTYASIGNVEQYIDLVADTNYVLQCWAYNTTPNISTWVGIRDVTPGGALVQNFALDSAGYQYVKIEFTAPSTGSHRFWCWGQANSVYHTDSWVLLKEGTTLTNTNRIDHTDKIQILNQPNQVTVNIEDLTDNAIINVYSINGQLVHTTTTTSNRTIIENSAFGASGSYFVQVSMKGALVAKQVSIIND